MPVKKIPAFLGINNVKEDAALEIRGTNSALYVRDAVNVDITDAGRIKMRGGVALQTGLPFKHLWQSPLHQDCFAQIDNQWVKVNIDDWSYKPLIEVGHGPIQHIVLNHQVCVTSDRGVFVFDGATASKLTIDTPPSVQLHAVSGGSFTKGSIHVAIAWLKQGQESGLSESVKIETSELNGISINFPLCMDERVTHVRLYMTDQNGGELRQVDEDYPIDQLNVQYMKPPILGRSAQFKHFTPMPHGKALRLWRGRLWSFERNVLCFSEAMTFHLTDPRYNFIQFPERISFIEPVEGGIWVGLITRVVFLRGTDARSMSMEPKASQRPVANGSLFVESDQLAEYASSGLGCAMWLAENGLVIGTADGSLVELHAGRLQGISGNTAHLVRFEQKIMALVS